MVFNGHWGEYGALLMFLIRTSLYHVGLSSVEPQVIVTFPNVPFPHKHFFYKMFPVSWPTSPTLLTLAHTHTHRFYIKDKTDTNPLDLLRLVLWPGIWSIFVNALCAYSFNCSWEYLRSVIEIKLLIVVIQSSVSLLISVYLFYQSLRVEWNLQV